MSEIPDYSLPEDVAGRQLLTAVHTFHALLVPEVHLEALRQDPPWEEWDPLRYFPQLEVFQDTTLRSKAKAVQLYLRQAARWLIAPGDLSALHEFDLRPQMVDFAERMADTDYDRPLWVDRHGRAMSVNQILPEANLLEHAVSTRERHIQSYELVKFIGESLNALADRRPKILGVGRFALLELALNEVHDR
jgi:hypothetical protein